MNLEEIYRKETELFPASMDEKGNLYYYEKYVKWLEEKIENLILCEVAGSLPTSIEPFSLITKQIIENADRVIEAVKKANTFTISQDTIDNIVIKPKR